jgi:hypothetical protein
VNVDLSNVDRSIGTEAQLAIQQERLELCQVAQIIAQGMRRGVALMAQMLSV